MIAEDILRLEKQWNEIDSKTLVSNVREIAPQQYSVLVKELAEITHSTSHTVEAWINSGRKNVKIPFLKLCMIAVYYKADLESLLENK